MEAGGVIGCFAGGRLGRGIRGLGWKTVVKKSFLSCCSLFPRLVPTSHTGWSKWGRWRGCYVMVCWLTFSGLIPGTTLSTLLWRTGRLLGVVTADAQRKIVLDRAELTDRGRSIVSLCSAHICISIFIPNLTLTYFYILALFTRHAVYFSLWYFFLKFPPPFSLLLLLSLFFSLFLFPHLCTLLFPLSTADWGTDLFWSIHPQRKQPWTEKWNT